MLLTMITMVFACAEPETIEEEEVILVNLNPETFEDPVNDSEDDLMEGEDIEQEVMIEWERVINEVEPMGGGQGTPINNNNNSTNTNNNNNTNNGDFPRYALEMLELVNEFRATGGTCGSDYFGPTNALSLNAILNQASLLHAQDMAENGYFEHESQDGRTPWDRMQAEGYRGSSYGENIAAGNSGATATFVQWKNSPGHCANMLSPNFTELGVGYFNLDNSPFRHYWVQNFASP